MCSISEDLTYLTILKDLRIQQASAKLQQAFKKSLQPELRNCFLGLQKCTGHRLGNNLTNDGLYIYNNLTYSFL